SLLMTTKTLQFALAIVTLLTAACGSSGNDGSSVDGTSGLGTSTEDGDAPNGTDDQQDEYTWPEPDDDRFSDRCTITERKASLTSTLLDPGLGDNEDVTAMAADAGTLYY